MGARSSLTRSRLRMAKRLPHQGGFTLIEAALTTVIIGVAFVAMLTLFAAGTSINGDTAQITTGMNLAKNVREMAMTMRFTSPTRPATWGRDAGEAANVPADWDDLNDLDNVTFDPPVDAAGNAIADLSGWQQTVDVECVDANGLGTVLPNGGSADAVRVTTIITHGSSEVWRMSWYAFKGTP
jgi:MSHA pilin protein MshD